METVANFIFGGSKITADGDCTHEIKRHLLLGRKVRTKVPTLVTWFRLTVTFRGSDSLPFVTDPKLAPALARSQQLSQGFLGRPLWT